ncbi:MAG: thiamine pyrophosphate-binding protein [Burkholderiales bacterium]|nr:thiamine pyrophosphate-binding protein [Burkholderiales bacterium]
MTTAPQPRTGGEILVDQLKIHGVRHAFCVPGESYLAVLDALYGAREAIELIVARQDGGAAFMAGAYGKMTGKPGICFVTRGPGATNASIAVHTAFQDSDPMILFVGQVASDQVEREAFQEMDYRRMFGQMAKWVAQIDRADRIPEYVSHAFHTAVSGRPGPVVLALPEDMLTAMATVADVRPYKVVQASPNAADMGRLMDLLAGAERPLVILGGAGWNAQGIADLRAFVEAWDLPVGCSFRFQDLYDNRLPNYVGDIGIGINPALAARVKGADLVLAIGARLGEMTTSGYTLLTPPVTTQTLVHVHNDPDELGRVYQGELLIASGMNEFAAAARALGRPASVRYAGATRTARADYENWQGSAYKGMPGKVDLREVIRVMEAVLPEDTVFTNGAGNFSGWLHRFHRYTGLRTQLAPTAGSMGYGVPAGVAAKVADRARTVVSFNGDGCYMMNGQELATAVHHKLGVIFVIVNNGMYGTIRMHQERDYPERVHGTAFTNPDFAALARAYGAHGETVTETDQFQGALERSVASGKPAVIEVVIDPNAITTQTTIEGLRAKSRAAR